MLFLCLNFLFNKKITNFINEFQNSIHKLKRIVGKALGAQHYTHRKKDHDKNNRARI